MDVITSSCGHTEAQLPAEAVLQPEHVVAHHVPAARFLPELGRMQRRQQHLLRANGVHLFADNRGDLQKRALRQKQVAVNARRELPDVSGTQQQLMTHHFRFGGIFAQRRDE